MYRHIVQKLANLVRSVYTTGNKLETQLYQKKSDACLISRFILTPSKRALTDISRIRVYESLQLELLHFAGLMLPDHLAEVRLPPEIRETPRFVSLRDQRVHLPGHLDVSNLLLVFEALAFQSRIESLQLFHRLLHALSPVLFNSGVELRLEVVVQLKNNIN